MARGSLPKYGEKTRVTRLPESIVDAVTVLLNSGVPTARLLQKLAEIQSEQESNAVTTCNNQQGAIAPNEDVLKELVDGLIKQELKHHNAILNDHEHRLTKLEEQSSQDTYSPLLIDQPVTVDEEVGGEVIAPLVEPELTESENTLKYTCPNCNHVGIKGEDFTKEGITKAGSKIFLCKKCTKRRVESKFLEAKK